MDDGRQTTDDGLNLGNIPSSIVVRLPSVSINHLSNQKGVR